MHVYPHQHAIIGFNAVISARINLKLVVALKIIASSS